MSKIQTFLDTVCPNCKEPINAYVIRCPACDADIRETFTPNPSSINCKDRSTFFYVSVKKLAIMSAVTFGLYALFWFYKNWSYVNDHGNRKIMPLVRSIFSPITFYDLIKEICKAGAAQGIPCKLSAVWLSIAYLSLVLMDRGAGAGRKDDLFFIGLIGFFSFVPLLSVQRYINTLNTESPTPINEKFTVANWIFIVIGGFFLIASLLGGIGSSISHF